MSVGTGVGVAVGDSGVGVAVGGISVGGIGVAVGVSEATVVTVTSAIRVVSGVPHPARSKATNVAPIKCLISS